MTNYINRETARETLLTAYPLLQHERLDTVISSIPAADVREVKRGHWNVYSAKHGLYSCSECHSVPAFLHSPFCPNCGADMREEQDGR